MNDAEDDKQIEDFLQDFREEVTTYPAPRNPTRSELERRRSKALTIVNSKTLIAGKRKHDFGIDY